MTHICVIGWERVKHHNYILVQPSLTAVYSFQLRKKITKDGQIDGGFLAGLLTMFLCEYKYQNGVYLLTIN